jgi:predicted Ser/Thr protein kinase
METMSSIDLNVSELLAFISADQFCRWESGERVLLEDYLEQFSVLADQDQAVLDLIYHEIYLRQQHDEPVDPDELIGRFPQFAEELSLLIEIHGALDSVELAAAFVNDIEWDESELDVAPNLLASLTSHEIPDDVRHRVEELSKSSAFKDLPQNIMVAIAERSLEEEFAEGELLVRQGDLADSLMIIVDGQVEIEVVDDDGNRCVIDQGEAYSIVGEIGLLTQRPRSANVSALTPVKIVKIPAQVYHDIAVRFPAINSVIAQQISERIGTQELDVLCGKTLNGFRIERRLGRGSMGVVYLSQQNQTGETLVLKMMRHNLVYDHRAIKRFQQEADILKSATHPNIIRLKTDFVALNTIFLVMEYCDGPSLSAVIDRFGPLPEDQVRRILGQLAGALSYAHGTGIVHRDLKPSNVLFKTDGTVKLTDFGLARSVVGTGLTNPGEIIGTPRYMPREQLTGVPVDEKADYYAFGCIAYELITGKPLFPAEDLVTMLSQQLTWSFPPAESICSGLSDDLYMLLRNSLQTNRDARTLDLSRIATWAGPIESSICTFDATE